MADEIKLEVSGGDKIAKAYAIAPQELINSIRGWLFKEKNLFVGTRKRGTVGTWGRSIEHLRHRGRPGTWQRRTAAPFSGEIAKGELTMTMGINPRGRGFQEGLVEFQHGATHSGWQIVPNYAGISAAGLTYKGSAMESLNGMGGKNSLFHQLDTEKRFRILSQGSRVLYFDRNVPGRLLFMLVQRTYRGQQFDFIGDFEKREPAIMGRGQQAIDKTCEKIEMTGHA